MPQITVPPAFADRIESITFQVSYETQVELRSPWTGTSQFLDRGYPVWTGTARVARIGSSDPDYDADRLAIEAFLSSLEGIGNYFEIPHHRPTIAAGVVSAVASVATNTAGELVHTLGSSLLGAMAGTRVRSGDYTYSIRRILSGNRYVLDPQRALGVGDTLAGSETIRAVSSAQTVAGDAGQP